MMTFEGFVDHYLDEWIVGFPCYSSPRFSTEIAASASGAEQRNRNWSHPLRTFRLPEAIRYHEQYEAIQNHWLAMGGPELCWPFTDPLDFASIPLDMPNVTPDISAEDQVIGVGNGVQRAFQLTKKYQAGPASYQRPIYLPQVATVSIAINGLAPDDPALADFGGPFIWAVERMGGMVTLDPAPKEGTTITAGFLFDVAVRFEADDSFDGIVQSYQVSGFSDLDLAEVRPC